MKLYIAEKPSLGRAIAEVLPRPHERKDGYIRAGNGDCVSWCIGHLLEQAEPEVYDPRYRQWQLAHLPIIPQQWQLQEKAATRKQLGVLRQLVRQAEVLVHAGDPDREGQLLVDQVLAFLQVPRDKRLATQRCLISDLNPAAVARALAQPRPNRDFVALSTSALARARADWLYGINLTRAYTLLGQQVGYQGVLSVGRVQTPVLGLVVRRDESIEQFVSKPYYEVLAHLRTGQGETVIARWSPSDACQPYLDEEGRVLSRALAENVVRRIEGQPAQVTAVSQTPQSQPPPLPFNLSTLQIEAARRFGWSAQQVLDACQTLYEGHKLITYPRSDCRHLPEDHYARRDAVLAAIRANCDGLQAACDGADPTRRSKAWDDKKVEAHHAIIPTERQLPASRLSAVEGQLYELIARQYVCQFHAPYRYSDTKAEFRCGGGLFKASARQVLEPGWKSLFATRERSHADPEAQEPKLPKLVVGEELQCERGELLQKQTQPPLPFTDATLLAAMTGIARFVEDPPLRKILRDTDGLGTEATRAGIIELLFRRGFLRRDGKSIRATGAGRALIASLPAVAVTPDMTARWEASLNSISTRDCSYEAFMGPLQVAIGELIGQSRQKLPDALRGVACESRGRAKPGAQTRTKARGRRSKPKRPSAD